MINKKSVWFLTLFSLIVVLSIYYITMPPELLMDNNILEPEVSIKESDLITALKVEENDETLKEIDNLKLILNSESTIEEKNNAFEKLKLINIIKGEEENLEKKVKTSLDLDSFIKIDGNQIKVVIANTSHDTVLANKIIRTIQEEYNENKYVTVKFQN